MRPFLSYLVPAAVRSVPRLCAYVGAHHRRRRGDGDVRRGRCGLSGGSSNSGVLFGFAFLFWILVSDESQMNTKESSSNKLYKSQANVKVPCSFIYRGVYIQ